MSTAPLRVVNWNLHGALVPGRATHAQQQRAWRHIAKLDADLALLQEVERAAIPDWAFDEWDLLLGDPEHENTGTWGSVIAAKKAHALRPRPDLLEDPWIDLLYDYVVVGEIRHSSLGILLLASVHAPARKVSGLLETLGKPKDFFTSEELDSLELANAGAWACDVAFAALERNLRGQRFVVAGDWNNARLFDKTQPRYAPAAQLFFARAAEHEWFECHALPEERTYFKEGTEPYQLDHVFCDQETAAALVDCSVLAEEPAQEVSDHAPMLTRFSL